MSKTPIERGAEAVTGGFNRLRAEREYTPTTEEVRNVWRDAMTETSEYFDALSPDEADERFNRWLAEHDAQVKAKALEDVATKRWVCEVQSSGYHNGATCGPDDPHEGWRCEYRYEFSVPATRIEREED